jgi:hypothetical protein
MSGDVFRHTCNIAWGSIVPPPPCAACAVQVFPLVPPAPASLSDADVERIADRVVEKLRVVTHAHEEPADEPSAASKPDECGRCGAFHNVALDCRIDGEF